jgi:DDE superfamily endonuclease
MMPARSAGQLRIRQGRTPKLSPSERLLAFIFFMKRNTCVRYEASSWNYSRSSASDDAAFVASAINVALADEISWPSAGKRAQLAQVPPEFPGCIGHVDGKLCKIKKPATPENSLYDNRRKHMYCFNNVVVVDHQGLFIFVDSGFAGSFHDVRCLRNNSLHLHWRDHFRIDDEDRVQEYLLGDPGYMGLEMYILRRVDRREYTTDKNAVQEAFNRRHVLSLGV